MNLNILRKHHFSIFSTFLLITLVLSEHGMNLNRGAIVTNGYECADIGKSILEDGGSAVDAAIASILCEGVAIPESTGLGGGFLMTIYEKSSGQTYFLNAREVAPEAAYEDMFEGNSSLSSKGGLSIAVPGELRGLWSAHQKFGVLNWEKLIQPTIDLCRNGIVVTDYFARVLENNQEMILNNPELRQMFVNPSTNEVYRKGDLVKRPKLAETLEIIAKEGADALYMGSLTKKFVEDIQNAGGIITENDLNNYQVEWKEAIKTNLPFNQTLFTSPLPGSGVILTFMMNILKDFLVLNEDESLRNLQRIIEAFKFGYGKRTELGDENYVNVDELIANLTSESYAKDIRDLILDNETYQDYEHYGVNTSLIEDHGTAHLCVLSPNGDAVSVTGTINLVFGSEVVSPSTGIILNDQMDDFSAPNITNAFGVPPSPANYIVPGKRPLSSMSPSIIVGNDDGDVKMIIGAAGGTRITTSIVLVAIRKLWFNLKLEEASKKLRLHHQLFPMSVDFENGFDEDIINGLSEIGHNYTISKPSDGFAALTSIANVDGNVEAVPDVRRGGSYAFVDV